MRKSIISGITLAFAVACTTSPSGTTESQSQKPQNEEPTKLGKTEQAERIDSANDPNRFRLSFVNRHADLPENGESLRKPFPSNWWPMRQAGIARQWNGPVSPAGKYDLLVHPDQIRDVELTLAKKDFEDNPVNEDAEPETFHIGPAEEWEHKNHGRYGTRDPENWYGHCNGWASYSINEEEPLYPVHVKYNKRSNRVTRCDSPDEQGCVEFTLGDINALGGELYWHDAARMLGRRCEEAESEFNLDEQGRVNNIECRDGNPAALHLVAVNMLGRLERPFIVDLNADREVWNYPVYKYELQRNEEITLEEALVEVGAGTGTTTWTYNEDAKRFISVRMKAWIVEDAIPPSTEPAGDLLERYTTLEYYTYILELDGNGRIIGGEWTGRSKIWHPDFVWYSFGSDAYGTRSDDRWDGDNPHIRFSIWKQILTFSQEEPVDVGGGDVLRASASPNTRIPDNNDAGISNTLSVNGAGNVTNARVTVDITHTYRGDLVVRLAHAGRTVTLANQTGGSADNLNLDVDLDDFNGTAASGDWTLTVSDRAGQDLGTLDAWGLVLRTGGDTPPPPPPPSGDLEATPNAAIPDNNSTGISSTINSDLDVTIAKAAVTVDITHTYRSDLRVVLEKGGRNITLHNKTGGSADDLKQTYEVRELVGENARGAWTLRVSDHAGQDVGTLNSWKIEITPDDGTVEPPPTTVTRSFDGAGNLAIPDNQQNGVSQTLRINDAMAIESLTVEIDLTHTYIGDLRVVLEKDGVTQTLHDRQGGSTDNIQRTFETLAFRNGNARGTWTIRVSDHARADTGALNSWKLNITGTPE